MKIVGNMILIDGRTHGKACFNIDDFLTASDAYDNNGDYCTIFLQGGVQLKVKETTEQIFRALLKDPDPVKKGELN